MSLDPIRGKTVRWTYDDGAMAGKTYEHSFGTDGTVRWTEVGQQGGETRASAAPREENTAKYEVAQLSDDVYVVSYLSKSGYTLTTVVDSRGGSIVSFASNEKQLSKQRGKLEGANAA